MDVRRIALFATMIGLAWPFVALAQTDGSSLMSELRSLSTAQSKNEDSQEYLALTDDSDVEKCRCPLTSPPKDECPRCTKKSDCPSYGCAIVKLPKFKGGDADIQTAACAWGKEVSCGCPSGMAALPAGFKYECQYKKSVDCTKLKCMSVSISSGIGAETGKDCVGTDS